MLAGQAATVATIERDFEDQVYVTVLVDDDPGKDLGEQGRPGHRFFFRADEVEPIAPERGGPVMTPPALLVAGIGNIFHGDDGFGVAGGRGRLLRPTRPDGVRVVDFGIRGRDLAFELLDGVGGLLLIDATPRGGSPGSLYVLEPETDPFGADAVSPAQAHGLAPSEVFRLVRAMGGIAPADPRWSGASRARSTRKARARWA